MSTDLIFNGIDATTGQYLLPTMSPVQISKIAQGAPMDEAQAQELKYWYQRITQAHLGPKEGVDPKNLADSGWGIIFAFEDQDKVPAIKEALSELLEHRQTQAGKHYREYIGSDAYRPGENKSGFLARHGMGPGPADPDRVPYYLLVVGDPTTIPYRFQYQLDVQYAVGRIHFDTLDEYAQYARSVVTAENGSVKLPRKAAFFGVQNDDDAATKLSANDLVAPLAQAMQQDQPDWEVESWIKEKAYKANLAQLLGGDQTPALLFTASHGMGFPNGDPRQLNQQGALLCQDWPGPNSWHDAIKQDFYYAADDLDSNASLLGLLSFHFACYGAGTPYIDEFANYVWQKPSPIAPHAFVAGLPRRMLGHPKGGALAAVGHVERAWSYSFTWAQSGRQLAVFQSTMKRLMEGHPIGSAVEYFNERYAELSTDLSSELEDIRFGKTADDLALAGMWTANNDARNYVILGDPAVRLPVVEDGESQERPAIEAVSITGPVTILQSEPVTRVESESAVSMEDEEVTVPAPTRTPQYPSSVDYGVPGTDAVKRAAEKLAQALQEYAERLSETLDNATDLEVRTYVANDMNKAPDDQDAELRAITRTSLLGDTEVTVPIDEKKMSDLLWAVHRDTAKQAQDNRVATLSMISSAATGLLEALKG